MSWESRDNHLRKQWTMSRGSLMFIADTQWKWVMTCRTRHASAGDNTVTLTDKLSLIPSQNCHDFFWLWIVLPNATVSITNTPDWNEAHVHNWDDQRWDLNNWWTNHMLGDILFSVQLLVTEVKGWALERWVMGASWLRTVPIVVFVRVRQGFLALSSIFSPNELFPFVPLLAFFCPPQALPFCRLDWSTGAYRSSPCCLSAISVWATNKASVYFSNQPETELTSPTRHKSYVPVPVRGQEVQG